MDCPHHDQFIIKRSADRCAVHVAGSTDTSLWTHYAAGERDYCGVAFPDGMRKNDRLARNVVTPTTKAADHDAPVSPADIVDRGLMSRADWDTVCVRIRRCAGCRLILEVASQLFAPLLKERHPCLAVISCMIVTHAFVRVVTHLVKA